MYDVSMDSASSVLFYDNIAQFSVQEGENRVHTVEVKNFYQDMDYLWPIFKFESGDVKVGSRVTLSSANYSANNVGFLIPDGFLKEDGLMKLQIVATDSSNDILDIMTSYAKGTFTGKIAKSIVYEFYIKNSIDPTTDLIAF